MPGWTLDELVERATRALVAADVRAPNGRVTEVPDGRMIRWYATIGLVDRPVGTRGRSALYGPRHLLQLVAIKRLQAGGRTLAEIQAELAGATDATLRRVALLPERLFVDLVPPPPPPPPPPAPPLPAPLPTEVAAPAPMRTLTPRSRRFWAEPAADIDGARAEHEPVGGRSGREAAEAPDEVFLHGVALGGAVLLLPAIPAPGDLAAIRAAAGPLLEVLAERGLLRTRAHPTDPSPVTNPTTESRRSPA